MTSLQKWPPKWLPLKALLEFTPLLICPSIVPIESQGVPHVFSQASL